MSEEEKLLLEEMYPQVMEYLKVSMLGKTWSFSGLPNSRHIPRIVIDPSNNNVVYAAVMGNLYKPTDDRGVL